MNQESETITLTIEERLAEVEARIQSACDKAGRARDEVRLLAVSKRKRPEVIEEAVAAGIRMFGENKVQEAAAKIPLCPDGLEWHLIGHLQSNKAKVAVACFDMIHSVDSLELLHRLDRLSGDIGKTVPVLLQVNITGESTKSGLPPEQIPGVLEGATALMNVDVMGLMTMPPFTPDPADAAPVFQRLRELRDEWRETSGFPLEELSMGMSHDFEVAIEAGATWVRVGSALLGDRK